MRGAWEACEHRLEGFTWEKENVDVSEQADQYVALVICLREKGYDVDDPTANALQEWGRDFKKSSIDWHDLARPMPPAACQNAYGHANQAEVDV
ncbi:MAG: hypothetical protein PVH80_09110 [Anaerolineae bacterium]|jgi:hypothetical protein